MKTKTWKLGEVCQGGIITVEIKNGDVTIINKQWDTSTGYNKSSNQSNAKELQRHTVSATSQNAYHKIYDVLSDLTTHYHAQQVLEWVEKNIKLQPKFGY